MEKIASDPVPRERLPEPVPALHADPNMDPSLAALRVSESRYRRLFEAARDGILLLNTDTGQIEDVNPYMIEMLGYSYAEFRGKKLWEVGLFADRVESKEMFAELRANGYARYDDLPLRTKAGAIVPVEFVSNVYVCDGIDVIQCNIRNITARKQSADQVRQMAFHDTLTKLPNRRLLHDRISQAMAANKRGGTYSVVMFIDLDDFKRVNDVHGHAAGDILLVGAAERLKSCVREMDTVARFGGDEFVVIIGELGTDAGEARSHAGIVAAKICAAMEIPYALDMQCAGTSDAGYRCTVSIGLAMIGGREESQDDILKRADVAMYRAKGAGGNSAWLDEARL